MVQKLYLEEEWGRFRLDFVGGEEYTLSVFLEGMQMRVGVKDLRNEIARILREVSRGQEVTITYRDQPIAVIKPLGKRGQKPFVPIGFGLWASRKDLKDVEAWLDERRGPRYPR